jgi:hypothetical protein
MGQQLVIRHVADCTIEDQARIGWVDIGEVVFDAHASSVILRSNFAVTVAVRVPQLDVELERTWLAFGAAEANAQRLPSAGNTAARSTC